VGNISGQRHPAASEEDARHGQGCWGKSVPVTGPGGGRSKTREKATEVIFLKGCGKAVINCSQSYGCWRVGSAQPHGQSHSQGKHGRRPEVVTP